MTSSSGGSEWSITQRGIDDFQPLPALPAPKEDITIEENEEAGGSGEQTVPPPTRAELLANGWNLRICDLFLNQSLNPGVAPLLSRARGSSTEWPIAFRVSALRRRGKGELFDDWLSSE